MAGFGQLDMWPTPLPGTNLSMPFFGEMLQFSIPRDNIYAQDGVNMNFGTIFDGFNLVSMLGPLGLIQHIWSLWEMVIKGKNIVILVSYGFVFTFVYAFLIIYHCRLLLLLNALKYAFLWRL